MKITYACSRCGHHNSEQIEAEQGTLECGQCHVQIHVPDDALDDGSLKRCLVCPSTDLFIRKDFPQRLGVAIVVLGFAASCVAWYFYWTYLTFAILFATALIDVVLYAVVGEVLMCYRCGAIYRGVAGMERYQGFNLETHERHRQMAARLAGSQSSGEQQR